MIKLADCHSDLKHYAKGMCMHCYNKSIYVSKKRASNKGQFSPGNLSGSGAIYWYEHPLRRIDGYVNLNKLDAWQRRVYSTDALNMLLSTGYSRHTSNFDSIFGGPGKPIRASRDREYERYGWINHPLAKGKNHIVYTHQVVVWQESGYDARVLELLFTGRASVHHRNTIITDNRPENLELRLRHPSGNSEEDWIHLLRLKGYTVIPPMVETNV